MARGEVRQLQVPTPGTWQHSEQGAELRIVCLMAWLPWPMNGAEIRNSSQTARESLDRRRVTNAVAQRGDSAQERGSILRDKSLSQLEAEFRD